MKRVTTVICCLALMLYGALIAYKNNDISMPGHQTVMASPPVNVIGKLPLDLQLDLEKRQKTDTVVLKDTIRDTVKVINTKYVKAKTPARATVLYKPMPMPGPMACMPVNNKRFGDREEYTPVELIGSKPSNITLTVDGNVVYSTKNDIHSAEKGQ